MGNSLQRRRSVKVMMLSGETMKFKTPIKAREIVEGYPGHVLLESEAVKHYGTRAKPLEADHELVFKRLYFLVEMPKPPVERNPRKVRSGINMTAKDRLENLKLARRSASDLTILKTCSSDVTGNGTTRMKLRLPKAEMERVMANSKDGAEAAAKIVELCIERNGQLGTSNEEVVGNREGSAIVDGDEHFQNLRMRTGEALNLRNGRRAGQKKVCFTPIMESPIEAAS